MPYTPNNPYIPGDPYSYDLKWLVSQVKANRAALEGLDDRIENLIINYLDQHDPVYYQTAQELIDSSQKAGSIAFIEGFYSAGDGGANLYFITDDFSVASAADFYLEFSSGDLWAIPVILTSYVTPEMFGAKGDGITDDTDAVKTAIDIGSCIVFNNSYAVDPTPANCITITGNNKVLCGVGSLIAIQTDLDISNVLRLEGASNISIKDISIIGDIEYNTSTTEGAAHCLNIRNSKNVDISNVKISNGYTDGIYILGSEDVTVSDFYITKCGRNGFTVTNGKHIKASRGTLIDFNAHLPMSGISVEPNYATDDIYDVTFDHIYIENCGGTGFYCNLNKLNGSAKTVNISFDDISIFNTTGNALAINVNDGVTANGNITISNIYADKIKAGVIENRHYENSDVSVVIHDVTANEFNINNLSLVYGAFLNNAAVTAYSVGGVDIYNVKFGKDAPAGFSTCVGNTSGYVGDGDFIALQNLVVTNYYGNHPKSVEDSNEVQINNMFDTINRNGRNVTVRANQRNKGVVHVYGTNSTITFTSAVFTDASGATGHILTFTSAGLAILDYYNTDRAFISGCNYTLS